MKKLIPISLVIMAGAITAATSYSSIGITTEAKAKVVQYATLWKISQRDAVSKIVNNYRPLPPFTGYLFPYNYQELSCEEQKAILSDELNQSLEWIDSVNN